MKHLAAATACLMACAWSASVAQDQSVWRCDEAGRVVYQGEPCRGGRAVEAAPQRPAAAAAEAARIAARERRLAQQLAAERRQREAQVPALAAGIPHTRTELSPPQKPRLRTKHQADLDAGVRTWRATRPSSRHTPD
jgi:hypothetical protein